MLRYTIITAIALLLVPVHVRAISYVAIGASDAAGIGAYPLSQGYVYQIRDELEESGVDVRLVNLGIPGARINQIIDTELPVARLVSPDLVTVFVGVNDMVSGRSASFFASNLRRLLSGLQSRAGYVVIANLPDITRLPRYRRNPSSRVTKERIRAYNAAIAQEAARLGIFVVDISNQPISGDVISGDGFHPNNRGYAILADAYLRVIAPLFPPGSETSNNDNSVRERIEEVADRLANRLGEIRLRP